jgi:hypothetical protein
VVTLGELAKIVRSKNAGPWLITFDIMFESEEVYKKVKASGKIGPELFSKIYGVALEDVIYNEYDAAKALKATIPSLYPNGHPFDTDVYGAQQHAPLLEVIIAE